MGRGDVLDLVNSRDNWKFWQSYATACTKILTLTSACQSSSLLINFSWTTFLDHPA